MNPPYDTGIWADKVLRYMDNLIAAAAETGARLAAICTLRDLFQGWPVNSMGRSGGAAASLDAEDDCGRDAAEARLLTPPPVR
jgi:hypothetical protein